MLITYARPNGFCNNESNCKEDSAICHKASHEWMEEETQRWRLKVPQKFNSGCPDNATEGIDVFTEVGWEFFIPKLDALARDTTHRLLHKHAFHP